MKWENHEKLAAKHNHLITKFTLSDFEVESEEEPFNLEIEVPREKLKRLERKRGELKALK